MDTGIFYIIRHLHQMDCISVFILIIDSIDIPQKIISDKNIKWIHKLIR